MTPGGIGELSPGAGVVLTVIAFLLWSAVALRLPIDGVLLGLVWFGVPIVGVALLRRYWNRHVAFGPVFPPRNKDWP